MTRQFEMMDKDKAWDKLVEYMWENEEAHWIEEGRPNDHIFIALKSLHRFLFCLNKKKEQEMEMTRKELNKMTKRELIEHANGYGVHPNREDIPKRMLIDLIIHHGMTRDEWTTFRRFIEELALPISEWEFCGDNPENPYITMWFKGPGYDNDKDDSEGELNQLD